MNENNNVLPFNRRPAQLGALVTLDHPISKGATGDDVRDLQRQLYAWGFTPGAFDGVYGSRTASAVAELQKILRLPMDGVFGPNTLKAVNEDLAQPRSMLGDREAQFINRPPPQAPAAVTAQVPPQLTPSAIVPASAVVTSTGPAPAVPVDQRQGNGVPWLWLLLGGAALVGIFLVAKGTGGLGEAGADADADADNFFEHDALLGVPQPRKRARRRNEDDDDTPDDIEDTEDGEEDNEGEEKAS